MGQNQESKRERPSEDGEIIIQDLRHWSSQLMASDMLEENVSFSNTTSSHQIEASIVS